MLPNVKPSQLYPATGLNTAQGHIPPQSVAAAATIPGAWIKVPAQAKWFAVELLAGALGGGSEQVDLEQATDAAGTGAKALATAVIAAQAVGLRADAAEVNLDNTLDVNNNFTFVRAKVTNTGGAGALVAVRVVFGPASFVA